MKLGWWRIYDRCAVKRKAPQKVLVCMKCKSPCNSDASVFARQSFGGFKSGVFCKNCFWQKCAVCNWQVMTVHVRYGRMHFDPWMCQDCWALRAIQCVQCNLNITFNESFASPNGSGRCCRACCWQKCTQCKCTMVLQQRWCHLSLDHWKCGQCKTQQCHVCGQQCHKQDIVNVKKQHVLVCTFCYWQRCHVCGTPMTKKQRQLRQGFSAWTCGRCDVRKVWFF